MLGTADLLISYRCTDCQLARLHQRQCLHLPLPAHRRNSHSVWDFSTKRIGSILHVRFSATADTASERVHVSRRKSILFCKLFSHTAGLHVHVEPASLIYVHGWLHGRWKHQSPRLAPLSAMILGIEMSRRTIIFARERPLHASYRLRDQSCLGRHPCNAHLSAIDLTT